MDMFRMQCILGAGAVHVAVLMRWKWQSAKRRLLPPFRVSRLTLLFRWVYNERVSNWMGESKCWSVLAISLNMSVNR